MAINPKSPGIHHISLRCRDMEITKKFYQSTIGLNLVYESTTLNAFMIGVVLIGIRKAETKSEKEVFNPMNIGLDHLAIACETEEELHRVAKGLKDAGVENTGVKMDETLKKLYVAFKDPDRIQWEFYMI
jgi:catechol 2,3-dioxygenase-like lactoylglutathione lyase family enzyme